VSWLFLSDNALLRIRFVALAAQSLGVIVATIPHLKSGIERHLPQKQHVLLADFDRLLRVIIMHCSEKF
jgi:hypothetical protein